MVGSERLVFIYSSVCSLLLCKNLHLSTTKVKKKFHLSLFHTITFKKFSTNWKYRKVLCSDKTASTVEFVTRGKTQLSSFFIPYCISLSFLLFLFWLLFNKHPGLVSSDHSFSSTCVKLKSRKQGHETAWHEYSFSALQVAGPWSFSSHEVTSSYQHWRQKLPSLVLLLFVVVVAAPACLHLIFDCRDMRWDVIAAPELFQFIVTNLFSPHFSHTQEKPILTSLMPSKRLSNWGLSLLKKIPQKTTHGSKKERNLCC